ncbi:MAG: ATP-dependent helicase [Candidatus Pacebacteria bacterium]|nr:ATP-dependent helicase [Candidatus Paceibacterota bacterium]
MNDAKSEAFDKAYKSLNAAQKKAVDAIDGPVMVVAGPGTGKTQILALRIANILKKTDTQADGILCLTFTRSGVDAMRRRLRSYIGADAGKVEIATFHSFGAKVIEEFYSVIGLHQTPKTMEDADTISLFDSILNDNEWEYIRPRGNVSMYYRDLKSLISLLKRERMSAERFAEEIEKEIASLRDDPKSISSRGESKGQLKKEITNKIEALERTKEVSKFFEMYEAAKQEKGMMDYDDILSYLAAIVRESEDARAQLRERFLYVLVDEHQDSSGVQNEFLKIVWGTESGDEGLESPNIFVVGDDRQLIYGFGGASLSHFEEFKNHFAGTEVITLTENYRSTQTILDTADSLLSSSLADGKLVSQNDIAHPIRLIEANYPRDEIISAGLFFKERISGAGGGISPNDCALLVPKNAQVRSAVAILRDMGLPASSVQSLRLFDTAEADSFITILKILNDPYDSISLAELVLDPVSNIPPFSAHAFLYAADSRKLSVETLTKNENPNNLFAGADPIAALGKKLEKAINDSVDKSVYSLIQEVGNTFFLGNDSGISDENNATHLDHDTYVKRIEIIRSMLHLSLTLEERNSKVTLKDYIDYIARLKEYGEHIPLAVFGANDGIQVMTLHTSKGLEFNSVWIAHMNERSLMGSKRMAFTLPETLKENVEKKDEEVAKRELYVAITRAKEHCALSYSKMSHKGSDELLASIIQAMPDETFEKVVAEENEKSIMAADPLLFVSADKAALATANAPLSRAELRKLVAEEYAKVKVSVTLLNSFYDCPWKWYFRNFLRVPEPLSESLQFGSVVHGAIERMLKLEHSPNINDITEAISEEVKKSHLVDQTVIARFTKEAQAAVDRFVENELPNIWENRESEKALSYRDPELPDLLITGKIDLLESDTGEDVKVTDFKTGKTKSAKDVEKLDDEGRLSDYMRQLAMYSYLINNTQKGRQRVISSRLYFVEEETSAKAIYQTTIDSEQIDLLIRDMKEYDTFMKNGEWTERPCNWKGFGGKETECPYCKRAKMYA